MRDCPSDINKMLAGWAEAFGGSLVFDGILCCKDRALVRPAVLGAFFPVGRRHSFERMFYRKDIDIWWWAKAHHENMGGKVGRPPGLGEHAAEIAEAYAEAGLDGVSKILGRAALRADEEALEEFKNLYCKARP